MANFGPLGKEIGRNPLTVLQRGLTNLSRNIGSRIQKKPTADLKGHFFEISILNCTMTDKLINVQ